MRDRLQRRSSTLALAVAGASLLLAACGTAVPTASPLPVLPTAAAPTIGEPATVPPTMVVEESEAPEPTFTDTGAPGTPPCGIDELKASRGITQVEGDERVTEILLVAAGTCSVDAFPTLFLQDDGGMKLVMADAAGPGGIDLVGGVAYVSAIRLSNWCLVGDPAYPVSIGIKHATGTLMVTGDSFPDEGDLPACLFQDSEPLLAATAWQPRP